MRTREATYADYGFKEGEDRQLKQYCLDLELPDKLLLLQCAHECNPMIEDDLFYSISKGVAFQILARKGIDQNYKCHSDVYGGPLLRGGSDPRAGDRVCADQRAGPCGDQGEAEQEGRGGYQCLTPSFRFFRP